MISENIGILNNEVIMNLAARVKEEADAAVGPPRRPPYLNCITCVAALAHHIQFKMGSIALVDVDLSKVPAQHLVSLVSILTSGLLIANVTGCDLVSILDSANCEMLIINSQSLGREETQALVRAMESRMEQVKLYDVELDMEALSKYSGHGRCRVLEHETDKIATGVESAEKLKTWAKEKTWSHKSSYHYYGLRVFHVFRQPSARLSDLVKHTGTTA